MFHNPNNLPIYVDLDGTLIKSDVSIDAFVSFIRAAPHKIFLLFLWLFKGKSYLKEKIARIIKVNPEHLPYNQELLEFLKKEAEKGIDIFLISGSDQSYVKKVAQYLGFFENYWGSNRSNNLISHQKIHLMRHENPKLSNFIYIGNSTSDIAIWQQATQIIAINPSIFVQKWLKKHQKISSTFIDKKNNLFLSLRLMRVYQWVKNILIFIPLLLNHKLMNAELIQMFFKTFISFSLTCSFVYIMNDIFDVSLDRAHPRKKLRPIASGDITVVKALILAFCCLILALGISFTIPKMWGIIFAYVLITFAYSIKIKLIPYLDVLLLTMLYVYRIFIGCITGGVDCSNWIIGFSFFLFLGLVLLKRYTEITTVGARRGYNKNDIILLQQAGISCSMISMLVFILYIENPKSLVTFHNLFPLWMMVPGFIFGYLRLWRAAFHKKMTDDPILYLFYDRATQITILYLALCFTWAIYG